MCVETLYTTEVAMHINNPGQLVINAKNEILFFPQTIYPQNEIISLPHSYTI